MRERRWSGARPLVALAAVLCGLAVGGCSATSVDNSDASRRGFVTTPTTTARSTQAAVSPSPGAAEPATPGSTGVTPAPPGSASGAATPAPSRRGPTATSRAVTPAQPVTALGRATVTMTYVRGGFVDVLVVGETGRPAPTGRVTVTDGRALSDVYALTLQPGQNGSTARTRVTQRDHEIWADYAGDAQYAPARSATLFQPIYSVTITVGPVPARQRLGVAFTVTASVRPTQPGGPPLIGSVRFQYDGKDVKVPVRDGSASGSLTPTSLGWSSATVTYGDDDLYRGPLATTDAIFIYEQASAADLPTAAPAPGTNP
ncbi:hypothetical protein I6A60_04190 [Frankia sp. AgB1.9]|uniref:hypothetical protein n=1 Tax=unclassified Frankia TaxID=2632575 RepID=UPI0019327012|nr:MULTISPECIES: hypothetical protein [unclassified Frankia]MBL7492483.1 hypothetical protein [Frankia sp. AgW1.1]MBL7547083.1 hypothetical protein [Frankia sp. AgB1.9]MBL7619374.1 hypothetical protein [Frankia sp. AgB1.8]